MSMNENKTSKEFNINDYPLLLKTIPRQQLYAINAAHKPMIETLNNTFKNIAQLYEQDGLLYEAKVFIHYFYGGSDWFITEYDPKENLAFGYVILNSDVQMSEFGYVSINELLPLNVEIDLHWNEKTLKESLLKVDESFFKYKIDD